MWDIAFDLEIFFANYASFISLRINHYKDPFEPHPCNGSRAGAQQAASGSDPADNSAGGSTQMEQKPLQTAITPRFLGDIVSSESVYSA